MAQRGFRQVKTCGKVASLRILWSSAERPMVVHNLKIRSQENRATLKLSTTAGRSADSERLSREGHLAADKLIGAGFNLSEAQATF
jgi:hypothetical protein